MESMIQTKDLTKRYGAKTVVDKVSICVGRGDIYGLIGKNGAGKTTLIKMLLGLTEPHQGTMTLLGEKNANRARRRIGSLVENPALYKNQTAYENMKRFGLLSGADDARIQELLDFVGLGDTGKKRAGEFSLGMKQRLGIAIALLGNPELLILDEPINGLDPEGIKEIRDLILKLNAQGVSFVISSHLLDELGKIATKYGVLANGVLVEELTAQELEEKCQGSLQVVTDDGQKAAQILGRWQPELEWERAGNQIRISGRVDSSEINYQLVTGGVRVYELQADRMKLEDYFIERMR